MKIKLQLYLLSFKYKITTFIGKVFPYYNYCDHL
jgi:hypothetical protein